LKPSGSRGLATRSPGPVPLCPTELLSVVAVVAFAVVGAGALDGLRAQLPLIAIGRLKPAPFHVDHGSQAIT